MAVSARFMRRVLVLPLFMKLDVSTRFQRVLVLPLFFITEELAVKSVMQVFSLVKLRSGWPRRPKKIVAWKMRKRTLPSKDSVRSNFTVPNIMLMNKVHLFI